MWLVLLMVRAGAAAPPLRIMIAYHSQTGNTAKMAAAVREGAASVEGVEVLLRATSEASTEDIVKSDGIVLGTPVHWGNLSAVHGSPAPVARFAQAVPGSACAPCG